MNTEQLKLEAALNVVSESLLHGWTPQSYVDYVKQMLPDHYKVKWMGKGVSCISTKGIEDDEAWSYFMGAFKRRIGQNFQEVYHNTCYNHKDFIIYIKTS